MRKLKLVKNVVPELVAYFCVDGIKEKEYRCTNCGTHVGTEDKYCRECGSKLDFTKKNKLSKEFEKFIEKL